MNLSLSKAPQVGSQRRFTDYRAFSRRLDIILMVCKLLLCPKGNQHEDEDRSLQTNIDDEDDEELVSSELLKTEILVQKSL